MDEFKVGDRVRLIPILLNTGHQPDYGTVRRFVGGDIDVAWDNGPKRSLHLASRLQLAKPPSTLALYVREITALQAVLAKRNATIGRLRAANRELRRELRVAQQVIRPELNRNGPPGHVSSVVYSQEVSPSPEPAFKGPLEVGGWYEDDVGGKWLCISIFLDEKTGETLAYCKKRNRVWFERFGLDGKPRPISASAIVDTIIRKVDPPGGES